MSEVIYSKKQINPLVEKYKINVEKNMIFQSLITMFKDQTNYQIWAIKAVFENITNIDEIQRIKSWVENNQTEIKNLIKGNVILYKTPNDFKQLADEIMGLDMLKFVKDSINKFNTRQRDMMKKDILENINNGIDALSSSKFKEWYEIFRKMLTLVRHRQEKLISTSSAINDMRFLKEHISSAFMETYEWNKDDMLGYMARNASDCSVVYNNDNIVVISVPSFKSSKLMCGNGRTGWCLTREESYFKNYVTSKRDTTQYFFFDFSKKENHELAHIGFTVTMGHGIVNAHSTKNSNLMGDGVNIEGQRINIHKALANAKVPNSVFIHLRKLENYTWNVEAFLKYLEERKKSVAVSFAENNRFILRPLNNTSFSNLIAHTLVDYRNFTINENSKTYVLVDMNLNVNDDKSVIIMNYSKDKYGIDSLTHIRDAYNVDIKQSKYLESIGISTDMFLNREKIDPSILLHKLIDENQENEAIQLISKEYARIDVNYDFDQTSPIFKTINKKMYKLFDAIINHEKFDSSTSDQFGETLLQSLIYSYLSDSNSDKTQLKTMIDSILNSKSFDFNVQNINLDTALSIASEYKETLWIVKKLVVNPSINVNVINDVNCGALGNAIRHKNIDALKLLGTRPDLVVREEDEELAKQNSINLSEFINPQPFATHSVENVSESSEEKLNEFSKMIASFLKSRK